MSDHNQAHINIEWYHNCDVFQNIDNPGIVAVIPDIREPQTNPQGEVATERNEGIVEQPSAPQTVNPGGSSY